MVARRATGSRAMPRSSPDHLRISASQPSMAVSFVNGFYCTSSCDVAKAKKGQDPHPGTHAAQTDAKGKEATGGSRADGPSVILGGALAASPDASRVALSSPSQAASPATSDNSSQSVDLLV